MRTLTILLIVSIIALASYACTGCIQYAGVDVQATASTPFKYMRHHSFDLHFYQLGQALPGGTVTVTEIPATDSLVPPTQTYDIRWGYARVRVAEYCENIKCVLDFGIVHSAPFFIQPKETVISIDTLPRERGKS